ncbi:MAG: hypothetical protein OWQ48_05410 [Desulfurococcus sp.]|nr:hypothetical protein [Desulfurococcus sp.]
MAVSLLSLILVLAYGNSVSAQVTPSAVVYIYLPDSNHQVVLNIIREVYGNTTPVGFYLVEPQENLSPLYYLYWLTTGVKPHEETVTYRDVNQSRVLVLWNNTAMVNNPLVDPSINSYSYNPLYNLTGKYIPPRLLTLRANESIYWDDIGVSMRVNLTGGVLTIEVGEYIWQLNTSQSRELTPPRIYVLENSTGRVEAGNYTMTFYVIQASEGNITLFYPGSIMIGVGMGSGLKSVIADTVAWNLVLDYSRLFLELPEDAASWWLNQTMLSLIDVLKLALSNPSTPVVHVYVPQLSVLKSITGGSIPQKYLDTVYEGFRMLLASVRASRGNALIAVFDPGGSTSGCGYLALVGSGVQQVDLTLTSSQLVSLLLASSSITPLGYSSVLKAISERDINISELNTKIYELNNTISTLNQTVSELNDKLATCSSENILLKANTTRINEELNRIRELRDQAHTYATIGLAVTLTVAVALGLLSRQVARRKHS